MKEEEIKKIIDGEFLPLTECVCNGCAECVEEQKYYSLVKKFDFDETIDTCPECNKETFVVEAEGIGCMDEEGNEKHYPIGYCKNCEKKE